MDASFSSHELLKSSAHWFSKLGHLFGGFAGLRANAVKALRNVSFVLHLLDRSFAEFTQTRAGGIIPVYTFEGVSGSGKSFLAKCLAKSSPQKRLRWPLNILSLDASALAAAAAASEGSSFTSTSLLGLLSLSLSTPHNDEDQERGDRKSSAEKCMEEARKAGGDGRFQEALSLLTVAARWLKGQRNRRRGSVGDALDDWIFLVVEQSEILCHGGPGKRKYFDGESQPLRGPAVCQIIETVRLFLDIWEKERLQIVLLLPISSEGVSFVDGPLIPSEWRDCVVERFDLNEYLPLSLTDRVDILRVQLGWHGDGEKEKVLKDVGQWSVSLSPADLSAVARCAVLRSLWKDENRVPKKTDGISEDVFLRALRAVQPSATKTLKAVIERPHTGGGTQSGSDCPALVRDAEGQWVEAAGFAAVGGEDELLAGLRREVVLPFRSLSEGKWGRSSFDEGCSGDVKSESGRMRGEEQQRPTSVILPSLPPVGILIEGETGTGKSLVSRALAVECGATLVSVSCTSLLSSLVGETERQVKDLFRRAKASAPAVLLLEDVHAIAPTVPSRKEGGGARDCSSVTQALLQSVDDLRQDRGPGVAGFAFGFLESDGETLRSQDSPPVLLVCTTKSSHDVSELLLEPHRLWKVWRTKDSAEWTSEEVRALLGLYIQGRTAETMNERPPVCEASLEEKKEVAPFGPSWAAVAEGIWGASREGGGLYGRGSSVPAITVAVCREAAVNVIRQRAASVELSHSGEGDRGSASELSQRLKKAEHGSVHLTPADLLNVLEILVQFRTRLRTN